MPESATSNSPQDVFSSSGSEQWSQENGSNIIQAGMNLEWNALPSHGFVPVASNVTNSSFVPNGINGSIPMEYNPSPNYINIPNPPIYHRHAHNQNVYPIASIPNAQHNTPLPVLVHAPPRPTSSNTWATPQNIKLIQTAWNKTSSGGVKKQKRVRTAFTSHQMSELEQEYSRTRYLDRSRRIELADMLRLNERTIKIWFQNRRMKEKKDRLENVEEVEDVSTTQPVPELSVPLFHEQYQANSEAYNRMGVFIEQYPVSSTSLTAVTPSPLPGSYQAYPGSGECPPYQQVNYQVQYPSPYSEVQELSPESTPQSERSISVENIAPSDIIERSWDLSWIKSIEAEEE